jgi:hypothetical protein
MAADDRQKLGAGGFDLLGHFIEVGGVDRQGDFVQSIEQELRGLRAHATSPIDSSAVMIAAAVASGFAG